jgi:Protein of unknown function (DUF1402)
MIVSNEKTNIQSQKRVNSTLLAKTEKSINEKHGNPVAEFQRQRAVDTIKNYAPDITRVAKKYNVRPEAIAIAIAWEGDVNIKLVPGITGRVHRDTAESIYKLDSKIPRSYTPDKLNDPRVAIEYIGAIMNENASHYDRIGVNIRKDSPVLAQLYQGGQAAGAAQRLKAKRAADKKAGRPLSLPQLDYGPKSMGEYGNSGLVYPYIREWLGTTKDYPNGKDNPYGSQMRDTNQQLVAAKIDSNSNRSKTTESITQNLLILQNLQSANSNIKNDGNMTFAQQFGEPTTSTASWNNQRQ